MTPHQLIEIFEDTQHMIQTNPTLHAQMQISQRSSMLFPNGYKSPIRVRRGSGRIHVDEVTTFQCAREVSPFFSCTAVLNFANPHEPGGGVRRGAMAQEECLCRCSDLYNVLAQPHFLEQYYRYHHQCDNFFSDRLIYSPGITVCKSDDPVPQPLNPPFPVDVITCAAPYLFGYVNMPAEKLMAIYKSRIRNILEAAMSQKVDCLILGAFGCGAFHNDPNLMARAFKAVLVAERYAEYFEEVIFAIKASGQSARNLQVFREVFQNTSV